VFFQLLELTAVLALTIRIIPRRRSNATGSDNFPEGFESLQGEPRVGEKVLEHDSRVILLVFLTINKLPVRR
jgi:hypothetical protein